MVKDAPLFRQVLLIEDDPSHAFLLQRALTELCETVIHRRTLVESYELLRSGESPELIMTDLTLPDSQGVKHVQGLRDHCPQAAIVVITSSTSLESAVQAMQLGSKDFLVKDFGDGFAQMLRLSLERVRQSLEIERERGKLQLALDRSEDGLAVALANGRVQYSNPAFHGMIALWSESAESLVAPFHENVKNAATAQRTIATRLGELRPGEAWISEIELTGAERQAFELSISGLASRDPSTGSMEVVVWVRNITEQKRKERFQRELLSTTTHDLKGPLSAILTGAELLDKYLGDNERARAIVMRMASAAQSVLQLIDEFLSARRIEEGSLILRPKKVRVREVIERLSDQFASMAEARRIELSLECEERLELMVDPLGLERVIGNLISNALKFTPSEGTVALAVSASPAEVVFHVKDSGSGMDSAEIKKVFERFSRLERHRGVAGSGLGLFVVKSIVAAHGGRIEARSKLGEGTTFDVVFPTEPPVNERGELLSVDFGEEPAG